ncbi:hypothetical protein EV207_1328 [Scopulibacillus darangshiensis]|uniref:Uncharacterized protein n=2 Tax=Scopulibacillus darangshiensis TaxID=442528 RepID=A0A4R2NNQ4_9BACL|nr:hypothetical protein EV207_1328 [Scopulibacillus darangshiensis]
MLAFLHKVIDFLLGRTKDSKDIVTIFDEHGLSVVSGKNTYSVQLRKTVRHSWGTEYAFNVPLGITFNKCKECTGAIADILQKKVTMTSFSLLHVNVYE